MAKQLNQVHVNLAFTADTTQVKAQLKSLQQQLTSLSSGKGVSDIEFGITREIQNGLNAATQLKAQLQEATNVNTGKLDLTKFSTSLAKSNTSLKQYAKSLEKLGPAGTDAFLSLSRAISNAEVPLMRINGKMRQLMTVMANTARWQLSSSVLHGFINTIRSAFTYAEDLNESLNNIRIVTGKSIDEMAEFADEANKAAKALSTTTTKYTDASLIFYQQGLNAEEVKKRTDVVVKMANVTGQSVAVVADQMTAVWNNFYDGTKTLDYYSDVMTALGAATASSTDEIAGGLEKFAAIGETIGLSYEYAASALATITANTRQSEDVVGTALKTIFARIQGLNLGETLDDGTTLNKYSEALAKVGISIFEQNGELKNMDNILDEMGAKWETLSKAQQTALAQTVAGIRQYTQLIALMDNWDAGDNDSMKANLDTAYGAEGALQGQADTYAESWEAASQRVKAAAESIWSDLIDDEFFIDILNGIEDILSFIDKIIDSMGGLKGVLAGVSTLVFKLLSDKVISGMNSLANGTKMLFNIGGARNAANNMKVDSWNIAKKMTVNEGSAYGEVKTTHLEQEASIQQKLYANAKQLSDEQLRKFQIQTDALRLFQEEEAAQARVVTQLEKQTEELLAQDRIKRGSQASGTYLKDRQAYITANQNYGRIQSLSTPGTATIGQLEKGLNGPIKTVSQLTAHLSKMNGVMGDDVPASATTLMKKLSSVSSQNMGLAKAVKSGVISVDDLKKAFADYESESLKKVTKSQEDFTDRNGKMSRSLEEAGASARKTGVAMEDLDKKGKNTKKVFKDLEQGIDQFGKKQATFATTVVGVAGSISQISMGLMSLKSAFSSIKSMTEEGEMTFDSFLSVLMSLGMGLPMIVMGVKTLGETQLFAAGAAGTDAAATIADAAAKTILGKALKVVNKSLTETAVGMLALAGWIALAAAAVFIIVKALDALIKTEKEARKETQEATEKYKEEKQALDELNDSLKTTKDRIDELNKQDTLTVVEEEELEKLKREQAYLERQIALQEKLAKAAQTDQANKIKENYATSTTSLRYNAPSGKKTKSAAYGLESPEEWFARVTKGLDKTSKKYAEYEKEYEEWLDENEAATNEWISKNKEAFTQAEDDYRAYIEAINSGAIERNPEEIAEMQRIISQVRKSLYTDAEYEQNILNPILNGAAMEQSGDSIYQAIAVGTDPKPLITKFLEQDLMEAGVSVDEFLAHITSNIDEAKANMRNLGIDEEVFSELSSEDWEILTKLNFENIETADELWAALENYKNSNIDIKVNGVEDLKTLLTQLNDSQKPLETALSSYKDQGYLTMDQVQELIEANSEYAKYIVKVGDAYKLADQALTDFQTSEAQEKIVLDEMINQMQQAGQVDKSYVSNYTSAWDELIEKSAQFEEGKYTFGSEEQTKLFNKRTQALKEASIAYQDGTITADEYFNKIDSRINNISGGFQNLNKEINDNIAETDLYEATLVAATGSIADGLADLNSQFDAGQINMDEYYKGSIAGARALMNAQAKTNKYIKINGDGTYSLIESTDEATVATEEYKKAAEEVSRLNAWNEQIKQAEGMQDTVDILTDNYDYLINYADAFGEIDFTIDNNFDTTAQQFQDLCNSMGAELIDLEANNKESYQRIVQGILDQGIKLANGLNTSAEDLQAAMSQDAAVASAVINSSMAESGRSISSVSQAAGNVLSALGELISNFDYTLSFTPTVAEPGKVQIEDWLNKKAAFPFKLPKLGIKITGSGGDSVNNFVSALNDSASFLMSDTTGMGQGGILDYGKEPENWKPLNPDKIETDNIRDSGDKYTPERERYHEINEQIKDQEQLLNRLSKAKDQAFGANRLKIMDDEIAAQEEMLKKQEALLAEQEAYLAADKQKVIDTFGSKAQFDEKGNLTNYNDLLMSTKNEEQAKILKQYEDTNNAIQEQREKLQDLKDTIQDLHFDKLNYKLELKLDLDESELKRLDYYLDKYSDDFSKMADSLELMIEKLNVHKGQLATYKTQWDDLKAAYKAGNIDQAQYIEGLKKIEDGMYADLEAMNQLEKEIGNFYEETLSEATSELEDHTDHLEHLTSVFEHYLTLMELTGRSKDYEAIGDFLGGKAQTVKDRLDVENKYYETLLAQQKEVRDEYEKALKSGDEAKIKAWKKNLDAITDEVDAAHEKVLSSTEEWVEAMKAVYENDLAAAADKLEKALTGGVGFEVLMDGFDKLNARQEEFLTKTNQIYETDKLMRTAHQALDKTDNAVSKQKLKNFIDETKALQESSQLSKYELEIQQAKYDLLVAEMALEEAKNAKSTVRLQRDSEGNFGYVYTADQDAVSDAEQNYYDAQNRLYNISLEGQQKYTEKFLQAQQDMYNELAELDRLRAEGTIATDEELAMRREQVLAHYMDPVNGILTQYSKLYNIAVQTDSKATADYWATDYGAMTQNSEAWKIAVNGYFTEVDTATNTWKTVSEEANRLVKGALDNSATATKNLKNESEDLRDEINDEVIPALQSELEDVDKLTTGFLNQQKQIEKTRLEYEDYLRTLGTEIKTNSNQVLGDKLPNTSTGGDTGGSDRDTGGSEPITPAKPVEPAKPAKPAKPATPPAEEPTTTFCQECGKSIDNCICGKEEVKYRYAIVLKSNPSRWFKVSGYDYNSSLEASVAGSKERQSAYASILSSTKVITEAKGTTSGLGQKMNMPAGSIGTTISTEGMFGNVYYKHDGNGQFSTGYRKFVNKADNIKVADIIYGTNVGQGMWMYGVQYGGEHWYFNAEQIKEFDTGGYTGDWGPEGKMAMLHQKELVLNADDTSNMLQSVGLIRDVVRMIDHNASISSIGGLLSTPYFNSGGSNIEQDIKIYAEFPSATNHTEIEEAFNNLLNTASQYANRKT